MVHIPVLQKEVLDLLNPKPNENCVDCTVNGGGHAVLILERISPNGKLLGIDWSPDAIQNCKITTEKFGPRIILACKNFSNIDKVVEKEKFGPVSIILFDLGFSSWQVEDGGKGFSFLRDEPLDMRYSPENNLTAREIVNNYLESELQGILEDYGQERFAKKIAKGIIGAREKQPIKTTFQLVDIIKRAVPSNYQRQKIHFGTRTFQAIRIAVNNELDNLKIALPKALDILSSGGRIAIISFHSLEDKIVKEFFKDSKSKNNIELLNRKPIQASFNEIHDNKRARSAKLRVAIKK